MKGACIIVVAVLAVLGGLAGARCGGPRGEHHCSRGDPNHHGAPRESQHQRIGAR